MARQTIWHSGTIRVKALAGWRHVALAVTAVTKGGTTHADGNSGVVLSMALQVGARNTYRLWARTPSFVASGR